MARPLLAALAAIALLHSAPVCGAAPPAVLKVEPPSWWPGHSVNPVRLLVRGQNLSGGRVVSEAGSGLSVGLVRVNAGGTYAFVDVAIEPEAALGPRRLRLTTPSGEVTVPFEILPRLDPSGRFQGFSMDDVVYLVMPDRFSNGDSSNDDPPASRGLHDRSKARYYHGGDLRGLTARLPYLRELGVTALWLNPWYDNVNHLNARETYDGQAITDYHGYGAVDFYGVDEHFGSLEDLRGFVDAAHAHGVKVIQDQVANHSGPYHPWVADSPTPTWFNGRQAAHLANTWQTWTLADPHSSVGMRKATLDGWFIDILPDLNQDDEEVSRYVIQNTLWWVGRTGLDGIRQDTLPYVPRRFWRDWMAAIKREHPRLRVVGELFDGDPSLVSFFQGGRAGFDGIDTGIDTLFDFPLYFTIRSAFARGGPIREIAQMLSRDHLYQDPASLVTFLGLHDVPRFMSEPGATSEGLRLALTFLMTVRGAPLIYYGDEIGMRGGGDPDNRRDFPGGWPGDARNAFEGAGRGPDEEATFRHLQKLARLRVQLAPLRRGRMAHLAAAEQSLVFARILDGEAVIVCLNNAATPAEVSFALDGTGLAAAAVLEDRLGGAGRVHARAGRASMTLGPKGAAVLVAATTR
jgi:neopullulanase